MMRRTLALLLTGCLICLCFGGCIQQNDNDSPTPSTPSKQPVTVSDKTIYINEYATNETVTLADEDGDFVSWVELYNYGTESVSMEGFRLTDDTEKPEKWTFPAVEIPAGGYLLLYLSDKVKDYNGSALHVSFTLTGKEDALMLFDKKGFKVDVCPVFELVSNLTYGRTADDPNTLRFFPKATPKAANTVTGFDSIDSARYPENKELVITEVAPVNTDAIRAANGYYYDYIELYNPTEEPVSLKDYRLSDKGHLRDAVALSEVTIQPKSYFLIWCGADEARFDSQNNQIYLKMGLSRYAENIILTDNKGIVIDSVVTKRTSENSSCGRVSLKDDAVYCFDALTPKKDNPVVGLGNPAPAPVFSVSSGYITAGSTVSITAPGCQIYYTTDGSTPTDASMPYVSPITVDRNMTIRAVAYMDGRLPSETRAGSYLVGRKHSLPVVFLSTDPANFFDHYTGIWADGPNYNEAFPHTGANYWRDWERPIHVEYVDENGQAQLEFDAGVKIFGQYSRANSQKSISINMRDKYGVTEVCYPFFGKNSVTNVYSELVLRASGQDNDMAHIRDAFCSEVIEGQMDLDYMDYQPVVVYLNGEYWGLYDLREKICESYVANRTGCEEDQIDMIKGNDHIMSGSYDDYEALLKFVNSHDLSKAENYAYVESQVDVKEFINYWIAETFFVNTDTGNIKFYQVKDGNSKWRWVMFDYDWALFSSTHWQNYLEEIVNPSGHGVGRAFETDLMRGLMKNANFRQIFLDSYVYHLENTFATERLLEIFDREIARISAEMPYQIEKWGTHSSVSRWESYVSTLREIVSEQNGIIREAFIKTISGTTSNRRLSAIWKDYFHMTRAEVEALFKNN